MSVLATEFDLDVAKKVWREEQMEEVAIKLLRQNRHIEEIMEVTELTRIEIENIHNN